jgi:imidazolonepropionase-like amidohydrolase
MAGTDAMNRHFLPGFSLHDELALLVESGLPPLAARQMATINPARFPGRVTSEGKVSAGKTANLVLLDADHLQPRSKRSGWRATIMTATRSIKSWRQ